MPFWQDIRFSVRSLRQNAALALTCFIVLALGIGANTTIFSTVKAILLEPLLAIAVAASLIPALKSADVDPVQALRVE